MKVVIIGGGIMGCACALELSECNVQVVLLERARPGAEASSAAAGMLGAQVEAQKAELPLAMLLQARARYATWATHLREQTGIDVGYRVCGILRIARNEAEHEELKREVTWQQSHGLHAELLSGAEARRLEPELDKGILSAVYFPEDGQVDSPQLLRALVAAVDRAGVEIRTGITVERVLVESGRCIGVQLSNGPVYADATVLAAGSWSSLVSGLPSTLPTVRPARGQIIELEERPPKLCTIVFCSKTYAVPRGDGRILCGSTLEFVGFQREVTAGGMHTILNDLLAVIPNLGAAQCAKAWSNFRPYCEKPLIGASDIPGLWLATGHHRNGILLAKWTAEQIAEGICKTG